jgi:hypothetical protein
MYGKGLNRKKNIVYIRKTTSVLLGTSLIKMITATVNICGKKTNPFFIWDTNAIQNSYENNTNPYDMSTHFSKSYNGLEPNVGVVSSTEKELLDPLKTRLYLDGNYLKLTIPEFNQQGIAYFQNSPLVWIWKNDGDYIIYKEGTLFKDGARVEHDDSFCFVPEMIEIMDASQSNTKINFPLGGAIKTNSTLYVCSPGTANDKGDFDIFWGWTIYQNPVVTDDTRLKRDLEANGAKVLSIRDFEG